MGRVRPLIAICPDPVDRNKEYWLNENYARFVLEEVLPHIDSLYGTAAQPALRGTLGASLGGLTAVMLAYRHPDVFGVAISQSGAFQVNNGALIEEIQKGPVKPVRFWLDSGTLEGDSRGEPTRQMAAALDARGYEAIVRYYPEGHSWGNWRAHVEEALAAFWPFVR